MLRNFRRGGRGRTPCAPLDPSLRPWLRHCARPQRILFGAEDTIFRMQSDPNYAHYLELSPTWAVATVLTVFIVLSLVVERSILLITNWLKKTERRPLLSAFEKMKQELMHLGFIYVLITTMGSSISKICIPSKYFNDEGGSNLNCKKNYQPFVSLEGLEQLHQLIFVMAITHICYSCMTMVFAFVKINSWRKWEEEAHLERNNSLTEIQRAVTMQRQSTFVRAHTSNPMDRNMILVWVTCFFRQFGRSVVRTDYLTLRRGFITNHNLTAEYDFHSYVIRSMEEDFQQIVGVSAPLWGFCVAFMLFNLETPVFHFWIALIPAILVLVVGTKLQHFIATLALESAGLNGNINGLRLRDGLFWFSKPELLLSLIHFVLFQNAFELASILFFWWHLGYNSRFINDHGLVLVRLIIGFAGQLFCSYSTLPLYGLVTRMGTNYKAALITSTIISPEEDGDEHLIDIPQLEPHSDSSTLPPQSRIGTPRLRPSASVPSSVTRWFSQELLLPRSFSMPR
ncbi:Mlo14p [Castilleja foliolosa]|uniref:MLO-like protein n=1 Tax=Castilleja foliolosa TaxID=1961234 RepID=A0ABD3D3M2_9LAMI